MNQLYIKKLAIECGAELHYSLITFNDVIQLAAYTEAVEAPLQARIAQLEDDFNELLSHNTIDFGDREKARQTLVESPSTWLSENNKEVAAKERKRVISAIDEFAYGWECIEAIEELK